MKITEQEMESISEVNIDDTIFGKVYFGEVKVIYDEVFENFNHKYILEYRNDDKETIFTETIELKFENQFMTISYYDEDYSLFDNVKYDISKYGKIDIQLAQEYIEKFLKDNESGCNYTINKFKMELDEMNEIAQKESEDELAYLNSWYIQNC